jgi:hypothetical protein
MTTVRITLPDKLAREAEQAGLLDPAALEAILREQLRARRIERLKAARERLYGTPLPAMTSEEIQAEIDAYRAEQRRAAGT